MENNQYQPYQQYKPWPKLETENISNFQPTPQPTPTPTPNPIPTPHPIPPMFPIKKKRNWWKYLLFIFGGIIFGAILMLIILSASNLVYTQTQCNELVKPQLINAYNSGALFVINYTLSTENMPFMSSEGTQLVPIKDLVSNPQLKTDLLNKLKGG